MTGTETTEYRTEDGRTVREGDLVYDYYSQEPVVVGGPAGSPGWFRAAGLDGGASTAGLLDGSRVCTMASARRYGHSMRRVPRGMVEERHECSGAECAWVGYLTECPRCGSDTGPVVRVTRHHDEEAGVETFTRDDLGITTAVVTRLIARDSSDAIRGYELRRYFGPEDEEGSVEVTVHGRDAHEVVTATADRHSRQF